MASSYSDALPREAPAARQHGFPFIKIQTVRCALWALLLLHCSGYSSGLYPSSTFQAVEERIAQQTESIQAEPHGIDSLAPAFCSLNSSPTCSCSCSEQSSVVSTEEDNVTVPLTTEQCLRVNDLTPTSLEASTAPGDSECIIYPFALQSHLASGSLWDELQYIGFNWARRTDTDTSLQARFYKGLMNSLKSSCTPNGAQHDSPQTPWSTNPASFCDATTLQYTIHCRTWVQVNTRTRVRVSLSAGTSTGSHAAWAALISQDSSGELSHDAYLSTRGTHPQASTDSRNDSNAISLPEDQNVAQGSEFLNGVDASEVTESLIGNFSASTVWLGHLAARQTQQMKWYYVSSVVTGTVDEQSASEGEPGGIEKWQLHLEPIVSTPMGALACRSHTIDFTAVHYDNTQCSNTLTCPSPPPPAPAPPPPTPAPDTRSLQQSDQLLRQILADSSDCNCTCENAVRTELSPFSPCTEIESGSTCGLGNITYTFATAECILASGSTTLLADCIRQDCELSVDEVALLRDQASTNANIIEPDVCHVEQCEEQYMLLPGEWSTCTAECWAENSPKPTKTRELSCYRRRGGGNYRLVDTEMCRAMAGISADQPQEEVGFCNVFSCSKTPCQYTEWSTCNIECGIGLEEREVVCDNSDEGCIPASCSWPLSRRCASTASCPICSVSTYENDEPCLENSNSLMITETCDNEGGRMATRFPTCAAVNLTGTCGGTKAVFESGNSTTVGSCAQNTTEEEEPMLCIKTTVTTAQCMSLSLWRIEHAVSAEEEPSTLECSTSTPEEDSSDASSVCCARGSVSFVTEYGTECCPWQIGIRSLDDPSRACCLEVDACGVCGGNGTAIDADNVCCSADLDSDGACCPAGMMDDCGVCGGDSSACIGVVKLIANIVVPTLAIPESPFCADDGTFTFGSWCHFMKQDYCDSFREVIFPASSGVDSANAGGFQCTAQFLLNSTGSSRRLSASADRTLQELEELRVVSVEFTQRAQQKYMTTETLMRLATTPTPGGYISELSFPKFDAIEPVCDSDNFCAFGEREACALTASAICKPLSGTCVAPPSNRQPHATCGGPTVGRCLAARSQLVDAPCKCEEGYTGEDCGECASGFFSAAAPSSWNWGLSGIACVPISSLVQQNAVPSGGNGGGNARNAPTPINPGHKSRRRLPWWVILLIILGALLVCTVGVLIFASRSTRFMRPKDRLSRSQSGGIPKELTSEDERTARRYLDSVSNQGGSNLVLLSNQALSSTETATTMLMPSIGEHSAHSKSPLSSLGPQVAVPMNEEQSQKEAESEEEPGSGRSRSVSGSLNSADSASMYSMVSTPRMPRSMGSTLPNAPFDTLKNCTFRSESPVQPDVVDVALPIQADPVQQPCAWFTNNLNAPAAMESESILSNYSGSCLMFPQMDGSPMHDTTTRMPTHILTTASGMEGESLMSPKNNSDSLMSLPKARSPTNDMTTLDMATLEPNTAALQAAYQSSFNSHSLFDQGVHGGHGQAAGRGRGRRFGGAMGGNNKSGYSAQLSTLGQRTGELQLATVSDMEGGGGDAAAGKPRGHSMQDMPDSPSGGVHTEQRAHVRAKQRADGNSNASTSPTGSRSPDKRRASTLLAPTAASAARNRAISPPKHITSTILPFNNLAFKDHKLDASQPRQAQYLAKDASEGSSRGTMPHDVQTGMEQRMHGAVAPDVVDQSGLIPSPMEGASSLSAPLAGMTSELMASDLHSHSNALFAAYGGSTQLHATAEDNDGVLVATQAQTEREGNIKYPYMGADVDREYFEESGPLTGTTADVSRVAPADTAELSRLLAGCETADISRDFVAGGRTAALTDEMTAIVETDSGGIDWTNTEAAHAAQEEDITAILPWQQGTVNSLLEANSPMESDEAGSVSGSIYSCASTLQPSSAANSRTCTEDIPRQNNSQEQLHRNSDGDIAASTSLTLANPEGDDATISGGAGEHLYAYSTLEDTEALVNRDVISNVVAGGSARFVPLDRSQNLGASQNSARKRGLSKSCTYSEDTEALVNKDVINNVIAGGSPRFVPLDMSQNLQGAPQNTARLILPDGSQSITDSIPSAPGSVSVSGFSGALPPPLGISQNIYVPPDIPHTQPSSRAASGVTFICGTPSVPGSQISSIGSESVEGILWGRPGSMQQAPRVDSADAALALPSVLSASMRSEGAKSEGSSSEEWRTPEGSIYSSLATSIAEREVPEGRR